MPRSKSLNNKLILSRKIARGRSRKVRLDRSRKVRRSPSKSRKVRRSKSRKVRRSKSKKVRRTKSKKVRRSKSRKVRRSKSRKVRRSKSKKVRRSKSRKVRRSKSRKVRRSSKNKYSRVLLSCLAGKRSCKKELRSIPKSYRKNIRSILKKYVSKKQLKPTYWPLNVSWPLPNSVYIKEVIETFPPIYVLSNGKEVIGQFFERERQPYRIINIKNQVNKVVSDMNNDELKNTLKILDVPSDVKEKILDKPSLLTVAIAQTQLNKPETPDAITLVSKEDVEKTIKESKKEIVETLKEEIKILNKDENEEKIKNKITHLIVKEPELVSKITETSKESINPEVLVKTVIPLLKDSEIKDIASSEGNEKLIKIMEDKKEEIKEKTKLNKKMVAATGAVLSLLLISAGLLGGEVPGSSVMPYSYSRDYEGQSPVWSTATPMSDINARALERANLLGLPAPGLSEEGIQALIKEYPDVYVKDVVPYTFGRDYEGQSPVWSPATPMSDINARALQRTGRLGLPAPRPSVEGLLRAGEL